MRLALSVVVVLKCAVHCCVMPCAAFIDVRRAVDARHIHVYGGAETFTEYCTYTQARIIYVCVW